MDRKFVSVFAAVSLPAVLAAASACACDEPGTPINVTAQAVWNGSLNAPDIVVRWTNTANNDETVWWDVQMTDGQGRIIPQRAGVEPHITGRGVGVTNSFQTPINATRCFQLKARLGPGNEGCISKIFSNKACATTGSAIGSGAAMCLDANAPDITKNGGKVQIWQCNSFIFQSWTFDGHAIRSGPPGWGGKCLDVPAPDQDKNGTKVQIWDCNNSIQQTWRIEGGAIKSGRGKCLDVPAPDQNKSGTAVQVWDCNNSIQQTWRVISPN
jgi:hypothetical protein